MTKTDLKCILVVMSKTPEQKPMPELSQAEKEAIFQELLAESERLFNGFKEAMGKDPSSYDEDGFLLMERAVEDAALAAFEAGNQAEHDRLMQKHLAIMRWRFGDS